MLRAGSACLILGLGILRVPPISTPSVRQHGAGNVSCASYTMALSSLALLSSGSLALLSSGSCWLAVRPCTRTPLAATLRRPVMCAADASDEMSSSKDWGFSSRTSSVVEDVVVSEDASEDFDEGPSEGPSPSSRTSNNNLSGSQLSGSEQPVPDDQVSSEADTD